VWSILLETLGCSIMIQVFFVDRQSSSIDIDLSPCLDFTFISKKIVLDEPGYITFWPTFWPGSLKSPDIRQNKPLIKTGGSSLSQERRPLLIKCIRIKFDLAKPVFMSNLHHYLIFQTQISDRQG
jgi:hypothetical protein